MCKIRKVKTKYFGERRSQSWTIELWVNQRGSSKHPTPPHLFYVVWRSKNILVLHLYININKLKRI
jgi:hypothetical protein